MLGDLDVIVETDPATLPLGVFVRQRWQRPERRFVQLLEERTPARAPAAHLATVQFVEQRPDRRVEFGQREEAPVSQSCQDPAPDDLHADFNLGLAPHCRLLIVWVRPSAGSVSPTPFIRSRAASSISSAGAAIGARIGSPTVTTRGGCARFRPI